MNKKKVKKVIKKGYGITRAGIRTIDGMAALYKAIKNHPEWYSNYPLDGLTQLNFGVREAARGDTSIQVGSRYRGSPADCQILVDLVVPTTASTKGGFWEGCQILMNKLRAACGSNITYDILDLGKYILDTREIIALYAQIKRTILALRITDAYDADAPYKYAIMSSTSNISPWQPDLTDLTANLAADTARMNRLSHILENMIPLNIDLHHRTAWMFSNIFADSPGKKFSIKMFVSQEVATYTKGTSDLTRSATSLPITLSGKVTTLETVLGTFMQNLQNSRIAGDILKAFGASAFMPVSGITEDMKLVPIYDEFALTQIQNATLARQADTIDTAPSVVTSPTSTVVKYPGAATSYKIKNTANNTAKIVNTPKDTVSPAEVISLTRLTALGHYVDPSQTTSDFIFDSCGTEICIYLCWFTNFNGTNGGHVVGAVVSPDGSSPDAVVAQYWSMDDYAPEVKLANSGTTDRCMMDLSNWAIARSEDLDDYHALAILSMLATPKAITEQSKFSFVL